MTDPVPASNDPARRGGRPRQYDNAAERARAWRERRRGDAPADPDAEPVPPELAPSALARVLEQLDALTIRHRDEYAALAARVEAAVAAISDPDAVAATLDACRTAAQETAAIAEARAADADRRRVQAEHDAEAARAAAAEAIEAADALDGRLREVEAWAEAAKDGWEAEQAGRAVDARRHAEELEAAETRHSTALRELTAAHAAKVEAMRDEHAEAVEALRAVHVREAAELIAGHQREVADLNRALSTAVDERQRAEVRLEETAAALVRARAELDRVPGQVEAARAAERSTLENRYAAEVEAVQARCAGEKAELEGRLRGCRAELAAIQRQLAQLDDE